MTASMGDGRSDVRLEKCLVGGYDGVLDMNIEWVLNRGGLALPVRLERLASLGNNIGKRVFD